MKRLIVAAIAAVVAAGMIAPVQAAGLRKKERRLEREVAHRNEVELNRLHKWERKHPHATAKQHNRIVKWVDKHSRRTNALEQKKLHVERRAAARARHRH